MPYQKTQWKDRAVERPRTYQLQDNGDGTYTLIPAPGTVYEPGTPVIAVNMNKIEQGIADAQDPPKILDALKTVDGAGSGLDADKLDGMEPTTAATPNTIVQRDSAGRFKAAAPSASDDVARKAEVDGLVSFLGSFGIGSNVTLRVSTDLNNEMDNGWVVVDPGTTANSPDSGLWGLCRTDRRGPTSVYQTVYRIDTANLRIYIRKCNGGTWSGWEQLWHHGDLRWNSAGYLEYNDGGTWRPAAGATRSFKTTFSPTAADTLQTVINITNRYGSLDEIMAQNTENTSVSVRLRITIDGSVVADFTGSLSQFNAENKYFSFLENAFVASPPPPINFTKSCRVEWQTSTGSSYPVVPIHVQYSHP